MCFLMITRHSAATAGKCRLQGELWESWGVICNDASHGHADKLEVGRTTTQPLHVCERLVE